jgi:hypothetical protein
LASLNKKACQLFERLAIKTISQNDNTITALGQLVGVFTKYLAEDTFAVVALDGVADAATGDHTKARSVLPGYLTALKYKRPAVDTFT